MLTSLSSYLANEMKLDSNQTEIIKFGLESLISTLFSIAVTLLVSFVFGTTKATAIILASSALLKVFAGGAHCKTMLNCAIFSAIVFTVLAQLVNIFSISIIPVLKYVLLITIILSFVLHYVWAPAKNPEKPISESYSKKLRRYSFYSLFFLYLILTIIFLMSGSNYFFIIFNICIGILWHTFTITPLGYKSINLANNLLSWIMKGGVSDESS